MESLEKGIKKLNQWFVDELEILDELAHDVATAESHEEIIQSKNIYNMQKKKIDTISDAIDLLQQTK